MKKVKTFLLVAGSTFLISSCAMVKAPLSGYVYTGVKAPVTATSNSNSSKVGTSQATSVLGWFAFGDASIDAAAKSAGISKIHHVDEQSTSVLGIFATYKVLVYGE